MLEQQPFTLKTNFKNVQDKQIFRMEKHDIFITSAQTEDLKGLINQLLLDDFNIRYTTRGFLNVYIYFDPFYEVEVQFLDVHS